MKEGQFAKCTYHVSLRDKEGRKGLCHTFAGRRQERMELVAYEDVIPDPTVPPVRQIFRQGITVRLPIGRKREGDRRFLCRQVRYLAIGFKIGSPCCVRVTLRYVILCRAVIPCFHTRELVHVEAKRDNGNRRRFRNENEPKRLIYAMTVRQLLHHRIVGKCTSFKHFKGRLFSG